MGFQNVGQLSKISNNEKIFNWK